MASSRIPNGAKVAAGLVFGPIVGLAFVIIMPFVWIVAGSIILAKRLIDGVVVLATKNTSFGWRPIEAYFAGKNRRKKIEKDEKDQKRS